MERIQRTWGLLLDEKMEANKDEAEEGGDLDLNAEEQASTPFDSLSQSCG